MGLPLFSAGNDPGPNFFELISRELPSSPTHEIPDVPHATTVVALKFAGGVIMVGDRRATSNYISSRDIRKIEAADSYTGVAISGSAARGMEFIRLIQMSFEHYEKMTGEPLSLQGKANMLAPWISGNNLSGPLIVQPLLAGFDVSKKIGRVFEYDFVGGCYERSDFTVIGSGGPFAEAALRLGFTPDLSLESALDLGALSMYEAGDNDPATGGPDFVRNIFPMMIVIDEEGFRELSDADVAQRFELIRARRTSQKGIPGGTLR
jgi:proteasome beta subunit